MKSVHAYDRLRTIVKISPRTKLDEVACDDIMTVLNILSCTTHGSHSGTMEALSLAAKGGDKMAKLKVSLMDAFSAAYSLRAEIREATAP